MCSCFPGSAASDRKFIGRALINCSRSSTVIKQLFNLLGLVMTRKAAPSRGRRTAERQPDTRLALLRSARKLFARDGYQAVTVRQLAAASGMTPAMVNYHFGNKEGLYLAVIEETVAPVLHHFKRLAAQGPLGRESLTDLLRNYLNLLRRERWLPPLVAREVLLRDGPLQTAFSSKIAHQVVVVLTDAVADTPAARHGGADLTALSLLAMAIYPFIGRSLVQPVFGISLDAAYVERMARYMADLVFARDEEEQPL